MHRLLALILALTAVAAAGHQAATADARRPASWAEQVRILDRVPPRCATVHISTIRPRYASSQWRRGFRCRRFAGNGIMFHRYRPSKMFVGAGDWASVTGMSDCPPTLRGVPRRVYRELSRHYCRRAFGGYRR